MTDKQIYSAYAETANYSDADAYASDVALSLLDPDDPDQEPDMDLFEQLRILWHVARDPFRDLLKLMGLNQTECSIRFCIALRTVQRWALEERAAAPYLRLMMAEATGVVGLHRETP